MNRGFRLAVAVFILSLVCLSCGGDGGGGRGPTEPFPPSGKRFQFNVIATSAVLEGALLEAAVFFDGREVSRVDWSRAGGSCLLQCAIAGDVQGITPGDHTVRFTVVRQTRPVVDYIIGISGFITEPATGGREPVNAPLQRDQLRAGESVNFTIRF